MQLLRLLWGYWCTKKRNFHSRAELEAYQQKKIDHFIKKTLSKSPYFSKYAGKPLSQYPLMNKSIMMENFDQMNTAGLKLNELWQTAIDAEKTRNFESMVGDYSVGLSSGTSNTRGIFVASPKERVIWASIMLAKALPNGLLAGERVALFLRSGNKLYSSVNNRWISFKFFDLFKPFESHIETANQYKPTIIIAPAQVLKALALAKKEGLIAFSPNRIFSAAEVLDPLTRNLLMETFGRVDEIYQATEGFLGITCQHGTMHLNEDLLHIEKEWLDDDRFIPIITDFTRITQPIVRYRLDDILIKHPEKCPCGSFNTAISRIEGRYNDTLMLPGINQNTITVFADICDRALAQVLPIIADYQLTQHSHRQLTLNIVGDIELVKTCKEKLQQVFNDLGVDVNQLDWTLSNNQVEQTMMIKKRRITRVA